MKKLTLLLVSILLSAAPVSSASAKDSASNHCTKDQHDYFILIHGIGGEIESFGQMKNAIENQIECSVVHEYAYATKKSSLTTTDFAKGLDKLVSAIPPSKNKNVNIISHSQGGIISLIWMVNSLKGTAGFTKDLAKRLDSFTTLSTPFWGSDFALMGEHIFFGLGLKENTISPFGKTQLNSMKYGSLYYRSMIKTLTNPTNQHIRDFLKNDLRILNIKAVLPKTPYITNYIGAQFFEGDLVVNTPSMSLSFNHGLIKSKSYTSKEVIVEPRHYNLSQNSYTSGTHMAAIPFVYAVAEVPEECITSVECQHPGFTNLKDFFTKDVVNTNQEITVNIQGFELHVVVELPASYTCDDTSDMKITIHPNDDISMSYYLFDHDDQEPISMFDNKAYFLLKGSIISEDIATALLSIKLKVPNTKERSFSIRVEKGMTTFFETNLIKK